MTFLFGIILAVLYAITFYLILYLVKQRKKVEIRTNREPDNEPHVMEPRKAPNPEFKDLKGRTVRLFDGNSMENRIVVFVNKHCIHCNNNLEQLMTKIQKLTTSIPITVVMDDHSQSYGNEIYAKYSPLVQVLLGDKEIYRQFDVRFFPAFAIVHHEHIVAMSPVPQYVIYYLGQQKKNA